MNQRVAYKNVAFELPRNLSSMNANGEHHFGIKQKEFLTHKFKLLSQAVNSEK